MPAVISLGFSTATPIARGVAVLGAAALRGLQRLLRALRNRHIAGRLARLDDRMLRDIGITRSDLRDAYSGPLWDDPTDMLAKRAAERRNRRRQAAFSRST